MQRLLLRRDGALVTVVNLPLAARDFLRNLNVIESDSAWPLMRVIVQDEFGSRTVLLIDNMFQRRDWHRSAQIS